MLTTFLTNLYEIEVTLLVNRNIYEAKLRDCFLLGLEVTRLLLHTKVCDSGPGRNSFFQYVRNLKKFPGKVSVGLSA